MVAAPSSERRALNGDDVAAFERHGIVDDGSDADLRAAEVGHDGDGAVGAVPDHVDVLFFLFLGTMGKVEPCDGDPGFTEPAEDVGLGAGGAEGNDDFGARFGHAEALWRMDVEMTNDATTNGR